MPIGGQKNQQMPDDDGLYQSEPKIHWGGSSVPIRCRCRPASSLTTAIEIGLSIQTASLAGQKQDNNLLYLSPRDNKSTKPKRPLDVLDATHPDHKSCKQEPGFQVELLQTKQI